MALGQMFNSQHCLPSATTNPTVQKQAIPALASAPAASGAPPIQSGNRYFDPRTGREVKVPYGNSGRLASSHRQA